MIARAQLGGGAEGERKLAALERTRFAGGLSVVNLLPEMETPLTPLEFARRARRLYPEHIAVIDGDSIWTYAQFLDRCDRWSAVLQEFGSASGDRVAYLAPNTHAQLESFTPCRN